MNKHLFLILAAAAVLQGCKPSSEANDEHADPVSTVKIQPLHHGDIAQILTTYGSVVAEPGKNSGLSVPYECHVTRTLVVPGQQVKANDPIVEIAASTATQLQVDQAGSALQTAETELKQIKQRYDLKLATNQEINQARRAADDARLQLNSLQDNGAASHAVIKSPADGIVVTLGSQAGQTVAAGSILAEIVAADAIEVRVGVEPDDLNALQAGGEVKLFPVNQPSAAAVTGTVRLLTASVNPTSRLVDVFVALPKASGFLLGGYVRAEFSRRATGAWIVPISALIFEAEGAHIFTARDGKAVEHKVEAGLRTKDEAEIRGGNLEDGASVIVEGNYELEDGMRVEVK